MQELPELLLIGLGEGIDLDLAVGTHHRLDMDSTAAELWRQTRQAS